MNNREKCTATLNEMTKDQLLSFAVSLEAVKKAIDEVASAVFCELMYKQYETDPTKGEEISFEEAAQQLGVSLQ